MSFAEKKLEQWPAFRDRLLERGLYSTFETICLKYGVTVAEVFQERMGGDQTRKARRECMEHQLANGWSRHGVANLWKRDRSYFYKVFRRE